MALRGKKPDTIQKRLKAFLYGPAKVGKTTAAIQFPQPYFIDTEKGAEHDKYVELLNKQNGVIFQCYELDDLIQEVKALMTCKHPYKTLIIDPITPIYDTALYSAEKKVGTEYSRHYHYADKRMKQLMNLLIRLDMNVIMTAHAKNEYINGVSTGGQTYDGYKKLNYAFDLIIECQKHGNERIAIVKGTRINGFAEGENFPFSYEAMANKYKIETIEKDSEITELASPEQVIELKHLINLLNIPEETTDKWLAKALSTSFDEMDSSDIQKCINKLREKVSLATDEKSSLPLKEAA